jgi:hypothetical protein
MKDHSFMDALSMLNNHRESSIEVIAHLARYGDYDCCNQSHDTVDLVHLLLDARLAVAVQSLVVALQFLG